VKAALDGLVDAKVLPDDRAPFVRGILMLPPNLVPSGSPELEGLLILVNEMEASDRCPICTWTALVNTRQMRAICRCPYPENDANRPEVQP